MSPRPSFFSPYAHDFIRVGCPVPAVRPADPAANAASIADLVRRGHEERTAVLVFPELCVSAYAIDDLLLQDTLLEAVRAQIAALCQETAGLDPLFVIGAPLRVDGLLYNCAIAIHQGRILGVTPKTYLPNYREFYERRWFQSGAGVVGRTLTLAGQSAPFGVDLLLRSTGTCPFVAHVEICEDLWAPNPPSGFAALAGAELLLNLSASNITIGKAEMRRLLSQSQSARPPTPILPPVPANPPLTWPGTARPGCSSWAPCWPRGRGSSAARTCSASMSISAASAPSGSVRAVSATGRPGRRPFAPSTLS